MDDKIKQLVREAIIELIRNTASVRSIQKNQRVHAAKVHFVPVKYRVLGGLIQSLNIKFGNFIEKLMALIVDNDTQVQALPISGKRLPLAMTPETDALIDRYITARQLPDSPDQCDDQFMQLLATIVEIETTNPLKQVIKKDVDGLFQIGSGQIIYLEIKYNDDHDTGKFVDINRKFIKTYAGLVNHLNIDDLLKLKPILYYFNPVKRWGPIYVPSTHVYRGDMLFKEYFEISYSDVDGYLRAIGDDEDIIAIFDELYRTIRYS